LEAWRKAWPTWHERENPELLRQVVEEGSSARGTWYERAGKCPGHQAPWERLMDSMEPERKVWMRSISNSSRMTIGNQG